MIVFLDDFATEVTHSASELSFSRRVRFGLLFTNEEPKTVWRARDVPYTSAAHFVHDVTYTESKTSNGSSHALV